VFLALMGEQWREHAHTRELAEASLRRFRTEIVTNRKTVAAVKDYHVGLLKNLEAYLSADPKTRQSNTVEIKGLRPAFFEDAEWDLALSTQSLAHIDSQVAVALSRIYGLQRRYADLTRGIMQAVYLRPMTENFEALAYYYGDLKYWEPALLKMYDEVLPQIDRNLGESPSEATAPH
jgi:gamma-glutamylcysteine synthetase